MMLYVVAIAIHVVVAVLAIGVVGAVPLVARLARKDGTMAASPERLLGALLRVMQLGFFAMLLTGILLDISMDGAFHRTTWFKVSIAVLAIIGFSHARARVALRKGFAPGGGREVALANVERWGWTMCAAVAVITLLMQMKPLP
jgi:hypothetical protein